MNRKKIYLFLLFGLTSRLVDANFADDLFDFFGFVFGPSSSAEEMDVEDMAVKAVENPSPENEDYRLRFPYTMWCGPGGADKYDKLGQLDDVDKCCRAHDHCDYIERGKEKHGLQNFNYISSVLHCRCDKEFRDCLKGIGTKWAYTVGRLYFSIQDRCYKQDYPIVACKRMNRSYFQRNRCLSYEFDTNGTLIYQWFDLPFFFDRDKSDAFRDHYERLIDIESENNVTISEVQTGDNCTISEVQTEDNGTVIAIETEDNIIEFNSSEILILPQWD